jgi:hypothetical protein
MKRLLVTIALALAMMFATLPVAAESDFPLDLPGNLTWE